jgi:hypothetical protein
MGANRAGNPARAGGVAAVLCVLAAVAGFGAAPATAATARFVYTGSEQTFTVPAGVRSVHVVAVGAKGGAGRSAAGGSGAVMSAVVAVTPGEVLYLEVGGNGGSFASCCFASFNGGGPGGLAGAGSGGGGGGASDVRRVPRAIPGSLNSRLVVAGGGGGGSGTAAGGPAGQAGGTCPTCGGGGGAGTRARGGAGGRGFGPSAPGSAGTSGQLGRGGAGGTGSTLTRGGGGGGGGGYHGGGGGGGGPAALDTGGGGGGSSFAVEGGSPTLNATGGPSITLSFSAGSLQFMTPFPLVRILGLLTPRGARIRVLSVRAPAGATIRVRCRGRGCPRRQAKRGRGIRRAVRFRRFERRLRAGTKLEVRVVRAGAIGKFTRFRIRRGRPPARKDLCLRPGKSRGSPCPDV